MEPNRINRSTGRIVYWYTLAASDTTVKISRNTLSELERLRDEFSAKSIDETVRVLIRDRRRKLLAGVFGSDKGRVTSFSEEDRGEDR